MRARGSKIHLLSDTIKTSYDQDKNSSARWLGATRIQHIHRCATVGKSLCSDSQATTNLCYNHIGLTQWLVTYHPFDRESESESKTNAAVATFLRKECLFPLLSRPNCPAAHPRCHSCLSS